MPGKTKRKASAVGARSRKASRRERVPRRLGYGENAAKQKEVDAREARARRRSLQAKERERNNPEEQALRPRASAENVAPQKDLVDDDKRKRKESRKANSGSIKVGGRKVAKGGGKKKAAKRGKRREQSGASRSKKNKAETLDSAEQLFEFVPARGGRTSIVDYEKVEIAAGRLHYLFRCFHSFAPPPKVKTQRVSSSPNRIDRLPACPSAQAAHPFEFVSECAKIQDSHHMTGSPKENSNLGNSKSHAGASFGPRAEE